MASTGTVLPVTNFELTHRFSSSVLWKTCQEKPPHCHLFSCLLLIIPTWQVCEPVEVALASPNRDSWNFCVLICFQNVFKFNWNILWLHGGVYSVYGVQRYFGLFCPHISCALLPLAWARLSLLLPSSLTIDLLQPVSVACQIHSLVTLTLKMEAQCFFETLVSTDGTV
jgi:hypothetical protein